MILVKELLNVQVEKHPYSDDLNEKLLKDCENFNFIRDAKNIDGGDTNVKALQTFSPLSSKSIDLIQDWILNLLKQRFPGHSGGSTSGFTVINRWVARYNKGDYTRPHSHKPAFQSFVYFIKSPKGSSPLVFTNTKKKIQPVEGVVVLFDGVMRHHVPPNNCEDRVGLAGNIIPYYNIP